MVHATDHFGTAVAKAGMDEKTARKYVRFGKLPSEIAKEHDWRTRKDPFEDVWLNIRAQLEINPQLEAKTLFDALQREYPGRYADGQVRSLQRKIKVWKALSGSSKEVFFAQTHVPGKLGQSDFTHMNELGVTIGGEPFNHLIYHFVLTYSNWETGTICFSESFESLSEGLQNALWTLGGVPDMHRTDRLTTAVQKADHPDEFTRRYKDLLDHYGLTGCKTNRASPNENGDVEQSHYRFKRAVKQALLLRGSYDFASRGYYHKFLQGLFDQLNAGRRQRFAQEQQALHRLPENRIESCKKIMTTVGPSSTIRANHNIYSVDSRLIGERIEARLYVERLEIWYGQKKVDTLPRLRGQERHAINYRHIIDSLVRKPGAFENYRYRDDLFPTTRFRIAYDSLTKRHGLPEATRQYLSILHMAARVSESGVDEALRMLIENNMEIDGEQVKALVYSTQDKPAPVTEIHIPEVDLTAYDQLLQEVCS